MPTLVAFQTRVEGLSVAAGISHSLVLTPDGQVYSFGKNSEFQLNRPGVGHIPGKCQTPPNMVATRIWAHQDRSIVQYLGKGSVGHAQRFAERAFFLKGSVIFYGRANDNYSCDGGSEKCNTMVVALNIQNGVARYLDFYTSLVDDILSSFLS